MACIADENKPAAAACLVSVCIPVYNGRKFIGETVHSVLAQNVPGLEIIVQDNASTDGTWEYVQTLAAEHPSLSVNRNETNVGMAPNWNAAINRAKGEFVMLLSADDLIEPEFIAKCLAVLATHNVDAVTTNHYFLEERIRTVRRMSVPAGKHEKFAADILRYNPFSINFTLFRRETLKRLSKNRTVFPRLLTCDLDLWFRMGTSGMSLYYLDEPLATYRLHADNLSQRRARTMVRHTELALLRNRRGLKAECPAAYCRKLLYFICKTVYGMLRGVPQTCSDRRLLRLLRREALPW